MFSSAPEIIFKQVNSVFHFADKTPPSFRHLFHRHEHSPGVCSHTWWKRIKYQFWPTFLVIQYVQYTSAGERLDPTYFCTGNFSSFLLKIDIFYLLVAFKVQYSLYSKGIALPEDDFTCLDYGYLTILKRTIAGCLYKSV